VHPDDESKPKPRRKHSVPVLFEDPITEDEEAKPTEAGVATKEVIAALLEESKKPVPNPRSSRRRRSIAGTPAVAPPRKRSAISSEATPAVGTAFIASLLHAAEFEEQDGEVTEKRASTQETVTELEIAAAHARFGAQQFAAVVRALDGLAARLAAKSLPFPVAAAKLRQDALDAIEERCVEQLEGQRTPKVVLDRAGVAALSLDHRAGFLLSLIDGTYTVQELLDVCGMPQMDALTLLYDLGERGVVVLDER
jgi:hypothetical protein